MAKPAQTNAKQADGETMPDSPGMGMSTHELCMDAGTITDVFRAVAATVDSHVEGYKLESGAIHAALVQREQAGSTAIGSGSAIPHAQVQGLSESILLDVKLRKPVRWAEGEDVHRCMVILVPPDAHDEHLELTARAVRKLGEE